MRVAALISGGKDSALALHRVLKAGHEVEFLVTMLPHREDSWMFHYPNAHLTELFAEAVGIELVSAETEGIKEKELGDLKRALATLDVEGVVFGAILSRYQKTRIDKICSELNLKSVAPLWQENPIYLLREIVSLKFDVLIVGVYAYGLDETWLGRKIDSETVADLIRLNDRYQISVMGEGGEYESLVLDTPFFKKRIELVHARNVWKDGSGYMSVEEAKLIDKAEKVY